MCMSDWLLKSLQMSVADKFYCFFLRGKKNFAKGENVFKHLKQFKLIQNLFSLQLFRKQLRFINIINNFSYFDVS